MRTETLGEEPNHWSIGKIREGEEGATSEVSLSGRGMDRMTPRWRRPAEASKGKGRSATGAAGARAPCAAAT